MKKIALIGNDVNSMINFRTDLIKHLVKNEHQVHCFATDFTKKSKAFFSSLGAHPVDYKLNSKGLNPLKDILATQELKKQLIEIKPDVVLSYFVKPVVFGTIAAKLAKVPRIIGMIEGLGYAFTNSSRGQDLKTKLIKKIQITLYKKTLPKLNTLILLNPDDKKDLIDKYKIKIKELFLLGGIGVDLNRFNYSEAITTPVSFIFIGRLLKEKGVFEYLKAAEIVKEKHPKTVFNLIGGLDSQNPFALKKNDLSKFINSETVVYPGHVSDVASWIEHSSVFVLPSYREGFPRSTQEAMSIGRAVITTDVPGCRETVENERNGFLIPPFSSEALAEKMIFFIENRDKITEMGKESRKIAEKKFNVEKTNMLLEKIMLY